MKSLHYQFALELITTKREFLFLLLFLFLFFTINIIYEFYKYTRLSSSKNITIDAKVLLQYKKELKDYFVLKLKTKSGEILYSTSRDDLKDIRGRYIRIYGALSKDCSFIKYLKSCFIISYNISLLSKIDYKNNVLEYIDKQHNLDLNSNTNLMGSLYKTLFFAEPMDNKVRNMAASLGIAHLFAISGFHLGVLAFSFYTLMFPFYRILQVKLFPYRNEFYDLNFIILCISFCYLALIDFSPSFLRAFIMFAIGFYALYSGIRLVSFKFLFVCILFSIAFFPKILFSIGFWLSVFGIFYIYLYLKYLSNYKIWINLILLNTIVFLNMLVISHYFFYTFNLLQILSPIFTILFVVFYPFAFIMHIAGIGGILDPVLYPILNYNYFNVELQTPLTFLIIFIFCSFVGIFNRIFYYIAISLSFLFFLYGSLRGVLWIHFFHLL